MDILFFTYAILLFLTLSTGSILFLGNMFGFIEDDRLSVQLDQMYEELETGEEINVYEYIKENK